MVLQIPKLITYSPIIKDVRMYVDTVALFVELGMEFEISTTTVYGLTDMVDSTYCFEVTDNSNIVKMYDYYVNYATRSISDPFSSIVKTNIIEK